MIWSNVIRESSDILDIKKEKWNEEYSPDEKVSKKYDEIFCDDKIEDSDRSESSTQSLSSASEIEEKYLRLFDLGDFFSDFSSDKSECLENEELGADEYDDNGVLYKRDGELLSNTEYSEHGHVYQTDSIGRIKRCVGNPQYTEEGIRNSKEQRESGGEERQELDDGGHIIAKILNGSEGRENLVPMRRTINRGDYKKMENEIAKALQDGKMVALEIDIRYNEKSRRPSSIRADYSIDGKQINVEFDNDEKSMELLDSLKNKISDKDYRDLKDEIDDMKSDGIDMTITSVKTEYNDSGKWSKITVGILDESNSRKSYKVYESRQEENL